jgi:hypothetical protein
MPAPSPIVPIPIAPRFHPASSCSRQWLGVLWWWWCGRRGGPLVVFSSSSPPPSLPGRCHCRHLSYPSLLSSLSCVSVSVPSSLSPVPCPLSPVPRPLSPVPCPRLRVVGPCFVPPLIVVGSWLSTRDPPREQGLAMVVAGAGVVIVLSLLSPPHRCRLPAIVHSSSWSLLSSSSSSPSVLSRSVLVGWSWWSCRP